MSENDIKETTADIEAVKRPEAIADTQFIHSDVFTTSEVIPQAAVEGFEQKIVFHDRASQALATVSNSLITTDTVAVSSVQQRTEPLVETEQAQLIVTSSVQATSLETETKENVLIFEAVKQPVTIADSQVMANDSLVLSEITTQAVVQQFEGKVTTVDKAHSSLLPHNQVVEEVATFSAAEQSESLEYPMDQAKLEPIASENQRVRIVDRPQTGTNFEFA